MRKVLWIGLTIVLLLAGGGAWWVFHSMDAIVAGAIRTYGPEITGVRVKLASVKIQAADGAAALHGLELGNPKGFKTERALSVGQISMRLEVASVTKDVVLIKEISIEQPEVTYEYATGGSNLDVIQRHVDAYIAEKTGAKNAPQQGLPKKEKKLIIDRLVIKGLRAHVSAGPLQGKAVTVPIPDLSVRDIGKYSGGVTSAEATQIVMNVIIKSVAKAMAATLTPSPQNLGDKLKGLFK